MDTPEVLDHITNVLHDKNIMKNPKRPVIDYDELVEAVEKTDAGWSLSHEGKLIMFVHADAGHEALHDALYELACRFNGTPIHPNRNSGVKA